MKAKDLVTIEKDVRAMILRHMDENEVNVNQFSKRVGLHQSQLWCFLHDTERGLTTKSLVKIGRYLSGHKV